MIESLLRLREECCQLAGDDCEKCRFSLLGWKDEPVLMCPFDKVIEAAEASEDKGSDTKK